MIYHITTREAWESAQAGGVYRAASLETEGFIHCSEAHQVIRVANVLYAGQRGLVLLRIDPGRLVSRVVYENASGGTENFPHVYGPLNVEAVERVFRFEPGADGTFDHQRIMLALADFQPIETERLVLRPYRMTDAPRIQELAGHRDVAKTVSALPHPYADGLAEAWIDTALKSLAQGRSLHLAIVLKREFAPEAVLPGGTGKDGSPGREGTGPIEDDGLFIGSIGLEINALANAAELGYWLGVPYWNRGYATEAARAMVAYGFEALGLNRIQACHMDTNPASGKVLKKIGMKYEGTLRQATYRFGEYRDLLMYSIVRSEYQPN